CTAGTWRRTSRCSRPSGWRRCARSPRLRRTCGGGSAAWAGHKASRGGGGGGGARAPPLAPVPRAAPAAPHAPRRRARGERGEVALARIADAKERLAEAEDALRDDSSIRISLPGTAVPAGRTVLTVRGLGAPWAPWHDTAAPSDEPSARLPDEPGEAGGGLDD